MPDPVAPPLPDSFAPTLRQPRVWVTATLKRTSQTCFDYLSLTKPGVISLLLLVTVCAMLLASSSLPIPKALLATLIGGYLAAGAAGALNCYLDRDIDGIMTRTRRRPLPSRRLLPQHALWFGLILTGLSFSVLIWGTNLLAALLAMAGIFYYVVIYTLWLKRRSSQNIVIGGAAGAIPALVGWAATAGSLSPFAWLLFVIIFIWTPPHFWALALVRREEYAKVRVPMLPVVVSIRSAVRHILAYAILLSAASLIPWLLGWLGAFYMVWAVVLDLGLGLCALYLLRQPTHRNAWHLYGYSLIYLALLFIAMVADHLIR